MTKTLAKSRILELIQAWSALAPDVGSRTAASAILRHVAQTDSPVTTSDPEALFVRSIVDQLRELIRPEYQERLSRTDIYVVNEPLCNAGAELEPGHIVLFDGLLEVLQFRMELSLLIAEINKHFDAIAVKAGLTREGFISTAFQAQSLSLHFLHHPQPLPKIGESFGARLTHDAEHAFAGGLLFILLHEFGHLELRHSALNLGSAASTAPTLACVEDVNFRKEQEFEADAFAFEAMVPRARSMLIVNAWYVMGLILDYESLAGNRNNTHPLAINRIAKLNELSGALDDAVIAESVANMFKSRLNLMESRLNAVHPDEHLLPTNVRSQINKAAYLKVLGSADDSRTAVDRLIQAYRAIPSI
jgi:hypothetical protein